MTATGTGLAMDRYFEGHRNQAGHPECPERITAISRELIARGLVERCRKIELREATREEISTVHSKSYINRVSDACISEHPYIDTPECSISPESFEVALSACGTPLSAIDLVMRQELANAFCVIRPPGHHAEHSEAMGFCFFNNIAIAAHYLMARHSLSRVLILDWDVHHGNGTQHAFENDPRVFFCSFHGHPDTLYPGTGYADERGVGNILNIPMPPGSTDSQYRSAFFEKFLPAAEAHRPEFILISAGFDAHRDDPIGNQALETESFGWMTVEMKRLARSHCGGKIVSLLEGGYNLNALGKCAAAHLEALLE